MKGNGRWHEGKKKLNDEGQEFSTVKGFSLIFHPGYAIHTLPMINSSRMSYCVWTRRCLNRIWLTMGGYFRDKRLNIASGREVCQVRNFFPLYLLSPLSRHGSGSMFPPLADGSQHPPRPILPRPCRENSVSVWPNVAILLSILYIIDIESGNGYRK